MAISRDLGSRTRERLTDPPTDSGDRRIAIGCGITALTILLTAGVLGLGIGVWNRFVSPMWTQAGPREAGGVASRFAKENGTSLVGDFPDTRGHDFMHL